MVVKIKNREQHISSIKELLGEIFNEANHIQYSFNGKEDTEDFGDVEVKTDSGKSVCLFLLGDGESVGSEKGNLDIPDSFELSDGGKASWERKAISPLSKVTGKKILNVEALFDKYEVSNAEVLSGWKISFEEGSFVVFYNCGDNAKLLINEIPNDLSEGYISRWQQIE